ncbi:MAG TPA: DUF885 domain-containing protein [Caldimonas sp.]|nr:DUF885 domain-containing protein [Caldimonas sp.]
MTSPLAALRAAVLAVALAAFGALAAADTAAHEQLTGIARAYIDALVTDDPIAATALGLPGVDGTLAIASEASRAARIARLRAWKAQVEAIALGTTTLVDAHDAKLLRAEFDSALNELLVREGDRKDYAAPSLRLLDALYTQFLHLPIVGRDGAQAADVDRAWDDIVARLERGPDFIAAGQRMVTRPGRLFGTVGSRRLAGAPDFLAGALGETAAAQLARRPDVLARFIAARDRTLATMAETRAFVDARAAAWPDNHVIGKAAYAQMLRDEQLLPFDAAEIERMARDELAHGWAEEAWLRSLSAHRKIAFGAASGGGMAPSGPALVGYYRDRIAELHAFVRDHDVVTVPDWLGSMEIVETPAFLQPVSPGASMRAPRRFAKATTGYYFITPPTSLAEAAERLDMNQDFDRDRIWSTAAHEAMPGHFLQLSIARRHPNFVRRILDDGNLAEGWAFYGEEMFVRLGLYGDDLDARLFTARWERVRGARAIVDPKLASGEWTVAEAVDFFVANSGFTRSAAQAAVDGIALNPGYVISYTVGRFQLQTLLAEYLVRTGERGSLRDFHDRLLSYGAVPFAVLGPELLADLDKPASAVRAAANY